MNSIAFNVKIIEYEDNNEMEYRFYDTPINSSSKRFIDEFEGTPGHDWGETCIKSPVWLEYEAHLKAIRSNEESYRRTKQAIYSHARANKWEWFLTYTFDPSRIDSTNYDEVYSYLYNHLKNVRKRKCPNMKYIIVPELHKDGKKYHFHALMSDIDNMGLIDSGKKDKGKVIYNISSFKAGWSTAVRIGNGESGKTANYISKYITKDLTKMTKHKSRYLVSRNLKKPIVTNIFLSHDDIISLKETLKEKTTSGKVVRLNIENYINDIEYINIKL